MTSAGDMVRNAVEDVGVGAGGLRSRILNLLESGLEGVGPSVVGGEDSLAF